jgi:Na+:H+ antiporter, NhaA family
MPSKTNQPSPSRARDPQHKKAPIQRAGAVFQEFFHSEAAGSIVLLACAIIALVLANSPWAGSYFRLLETKIGFVWGEAEFLLTLHHWVNDGLMAIFFFVVGLEIKREVVAGELSSPRQALLPVMAALGGMLAPAAIYLVFNAGGPGIQGWGVPMATDIAFALGILALLGSRVPVGLKIFLTALAIADDLGAVLVIALFYTEHINWIALLAAGVLLAVMSATNLLHSRRMVIFIFLALAVWFTDYLSGVHATVAGILVALVVPVTARADPRLAVDSAIEQLRHIKAMNPTKESVIGNGDQFLALEAQYEKVRDTLPPGLVLEHQLHPFVAFVVLPLFALTNAGVRLGGEASLSALNSVSIGIVLGLLIGKPLGIMLFSWLAVKSGRAGLPEGVSWGQIAGVGILAGIGFTMALFISELAFQDPALLNAAKLAILAASTVAGIVGYFSLRFLLAQQTA